MRRKLLAGLVLSVLSSTHALALVFPKHSDICVGGIVSKPMLAKAFINQNTDWQKLYINANDAGAEPKWRRMLIDEHFCRDDPGCLGPPADKSAQSGKKLAPDDSAAQKLLGRMRFDVAGAIQTSVDGRFYSMANREIGTDYFFGGDNQNAISCVGQDIPDAPKPTVISLPIRLRANSDDLNVDAARDKNLFKTVKPATLSFTRDGIQKSNATKLQATVGYAIPLIAGEDQSRGLTYFNGEMVPFISAYQGITKVDGKPSTYADTNNVAIGSLFNTQAVFTALPGVNNVLGVKPQYLWNTKDRSEIASLALIYQPWTNLLNTPFNLVSFLRQLG